MAIRLFTIKFSLISMSDGLLPFSGVGVRSAILKAIASVEPFLARSIRSGAFHIHVTSILESDSIDYRCGSQDISVTRGSPYFLKIISDSKRLPQILRSWIFRNPKLSLGGIVFDISDMRVNEVDISEFEGESHRNFRIYFLSPTCFHKAQSPYCSLFPAAGFIFQSLASNWRKFNPESDINPRQFRRWAQLSFAETGYELCTSKPLRLPDGRNTVGFLGWTNYKHVLHPGWSEKEHEEMLKKSWMLLRFGEYIGVGLGNTVGFGRIKVEPK
ncbi:MAG TPA: CRISPR-associated endoribonuclease Cas6 [Candidatus Korarchaeota archaeon]|nr:CRISPR-associated endoribonuclease Cas6 [Candidatus Korarchaeota archaeon]